MDSKVGLIVQLNGVFLITVLSFFMRRSLKLPALKYWTTAWLSLSFSLICLQLAFAYEQLATIFYTYYFLGEYIFAFLLVAGCRSLDGSYELRTRKELYVVPFVAAAIMIPLAAPDFAHAFSIHSLILAGFFAVSFYHLGRQKVRNFGWKVMHVAVLLISIHYVLEFALFSLRQWLQVEADLLTYNSIIGLVLQTTLGFGMVMVLLEKVLSEAKAANESLRHAQEQLELLAHTDPLTAAFNRHAFFGFVHQNGEDGTKASGCVGFFDIDDLKGINDCYGHSAGDAAIRAVVRAIREIVRAEDLIYRWGGDEFFVIMVSMDAEMAEERMGRLDHMLRSVKVDGLAEPLTISVSWGFTNYNDPADLERAIKSADAAMYSRKQDRKRSRIPASSLQPVPMQTENVHA